MRYSECKTQWDIALTLPEAFVTVDSWASRRRIGGHARSEKDAQDYLNGGFVGGIPIFCSAGTGPERVAAQDDPGRYLLLRNVYEGAFIELISGDLWR